MRRPHVIVYLDPPMLEALRASASMHRHTMSGEVRTAIRHHLSRMAAQVQDAQAAPVLDALLRDRIGELETWLRPMMAATSIHAATAVLLALEVLCGSRVDPAKARETLDLMRGRAYKMLRKRDGGEPTGLPQTQQ